MSKNLIIFIPGTFDKEHEWTKRGGDIPEKLRQSQIFHDAEFKVHEWDYANSHFSRQEAGFELAAKISALDAKKHFHRRIIIAHSHGGNVALYAARHLDNQGISTEIICLGTPFLPVRFWNSLRFEFPIIVTFRLVISMAIGLMLAVVLYYAICIFGIIEAMSPLGESLMWLYVEVREPFVEFVAGFSEGKLITPLEQEFPSLQLIKQFPAFMAVGTLFVLITPLLSLQYNLSKIIVEFFAYGREPSSEWIARVTMLKKPIYVVTYKMRIFRNLFQHRFLTVISWSVVTLGLMVTFVNVVQVVLMGLSDAGLISDVTGYAKYISTISPNGYTKTVLEWGINVTSGWLSWLRMPLFFLAILLFVSLPFYSIFKPLEWCYFSSWMIYLPMYYGILQYARRWRKELYIPPLGSTHLLSISYRKDEAAFLLGTLNMISCSPRMLAFSVIDFLKKLWNFGGKYFAGFLFLAFALDQSGVLRSLHILSQDGNFILPKFELIIIIPLIILEGIVLLSLISTITAFVRSHPLGFGWENPVLHLFLDLKPSVSAKHLDCASLHEVRINPEGKWSVFYKHGDIKKNPKVAELIMDWLNEERSFENRVTLL